MCVWSRFYAGETHAPQKLAVSSKKYRLCDLVVEQFCETESFFRGVWAPKRACRGEPPSHLLVTAHSSVKVGGTFWSSPGKSRFDTGVGGSQFWRLIWAESVRGVYGQREVGPIFGRMKSFERAPRFAVGTASCTEAIPNIGPTSPGALLATTPQVAEIQSVLQALMGRASVGICGRRLPRLCRSNRFSVPDEGPQPSSGVRVTRVFDSLRSAFRLGCRAFARSAGFFWIDNGTYPRVSPPDRWTFPPGRSSRTLPDRWCSKTSRYWKQDQQSRTTDVEDARAEDLANSNSHGGYQFWAEIFTS